MAKNQNRRAWIGLAFLGIAMALLLFLTAGTVDYWQAWGYLAIFLGASAAQTVYLIKRDPALLERRLRGGPVAEKRPAQKIIMTFTSLGFIALLVVPALDRRHGWSSMPPAVVIAGYAATAIGFAIIFRVYKENTFTAATIEIAKDHRVISTGPYAIVRHPMYAGGLFYLAAVPPALGSWWGLLPLAATLPFLIWRIFDEEKLLTKSLPGYPEYREKVRWRLIPGVF